ncbi:protein mono-ADP-ribosyltransferase PARP12-like isoform X1 [Pelodiscus sinensis]|uniref:protein mono-ADP-ribosyltransferase PARP12-like isoform X1 n=1 Tax=Pelodiscus sinensis TaxID=13735 RepID=UPI003F6B649B
MRLNSIVRMEHIWYWLDGSGQWIEYGKQHANYYAATVTSADLEAAFLADQKGTVLFQAGSQQYEINFQEMVQINLLYQTRRKVCRWPKLVFFGGEDKRERSQRETTSPLHLFPPNWDQSALPDIGYQLVELSNTTSEYREVKDLFEKTMKDYRICRLQRIQNPSLWQVFQWQKEQMRKTNIGKDVDERLLFHGTTASHLDTICWQNFDWRICGAHGTAFGKGSYFARDASYSHKYCPADTSSKTMFVARVLVGDFVEGSSSYLRPPPRPSHPNRFYDSCVDSLVNPSIFVIFEKHQIYPAYTIEYTEEYRCAIL